MKRKILSVLIIIFVLCTSMFSLVACEETPIAHTHNYATLKYDNESHWFECECEDKSNVTLHDIKMANVLVVMLCHTLFSMKFLIVARMPRLLHIQAHLR